MAKEYFFLYLIYGFSFINMGIFSIQEKDIEVSNLPLVKSLKYLGIFGITHGITEWITMITIIGFYPHLEIEIFIIKQILKAVSFVGLILFGTSLLPLEEKYKKRINKTPLILFSLWLMGFLLYMKSYGMSYHILNPKYNTITLRYFMALPGGIISAVALYLNAGLIEKTKQIKMAKRYKSLSYVFLIYGLIDGLIVRKMDFFPANIINNISFQRLFGIPIQVLKTMVGIIIVFLLIKVIDTFSWEQKEKLNRLQKQRVSYEERRKLGLEIHDSIMQKLYATGLKIEFLIKSGKEEIREDTLREIKQDLNNTIDKTREFLTSTALDTIELEDLKDSLEELVKNINSNQGIDIKLKCEMDSLNLGQLSPEKSTQIYYIIQESITNIIKHSKASHGEIYLQGKYEFLYIRVIDNGIGISIDNSNFNEQFGINSMNERTERIGGVFSIERIKQGTKIEIKVPWEDGSL